MIIRTNQLSKVDLEAVLELARACQEKDGGTPSLYNSLLLQARTSDNNLLYYENDQLQGFLSVYFFYEEACEISLMVNPNYRCLGIGKSLIKAILPLLAIKKMKKVIFSSPPRPHDSPPQKEFSHASREYHMERESLKPILGVAQNLFIRKANIKDISVLSHLDEICFKVPKEGIKERFNYLLTNSHYILFLAFLQNKAIGKAHLFHEKNETATLSDIAILPKYQKQGFGAELLTHCINFALEQEYFKLNLDVETNNNQALNLYTRHDFKIKKITDYWSIDYDVLNKLYKV